MGAQPNDFKYVLKYENKEHVLVFAPMGWEKDTKVNFSRDKDYFGVFRKFSLPLNFTYDGRDILQAAFDKYGYEAEVEIKIYLLDKSTWAYKPFFDGDIDFSTYEFTGDSVSVALMDAGIAKNIKASESITFEYSLTGADVVNIVLPGIRFTDEILWAFLATDTTNLNANKKYIPGMDLIKQNESDFAEGFNIEQTNAQDNSDFSGHTFVRSKRPEGVTLKFTGRIKGAVVNGAAFSSNIDVSIDIRRLSDKVSIYNLVYISENWSPNQIRPFDKEIDFTVTLPLNEGLYIYCTTGTQSGTTVTSIITEGELKSEMSSVSDPSNCKGIKAIDLFGKIINRISPGTAAISHRLSSYWRDLVFTSGNGIRETADAKIKISWKDFFETFRSLDDIGFGIENRSAVLELASDFVRQAVIFDLGEVSECSINVANEFIFNSVKIGYNDGNTDEKNGLEEFNSGQEWAMPVTRINKPMDWKSPVRADQFGIEKVRVEYNVKNTGSSKDTPSDNDTFMIDCFFDGTNYRPKLGGSYTLVKGLSSPLSAYNLELTPKKNLLRHGAYLTSMLDKLSGRWINFASGDKNTSLVTVINGVRVAESENIQVASLGEGYFLPLVANIKGLMPKLALQKIDGAPYGVIPFTFKGKSYRGCILDLDVDVARNSNHELKLLLCSN